VGGGWGSCQNAAIANGNGDDSRPRARPPLYVDGRRRACSPQAFGRRQVKVMAGADEEGIKQVAVTYTNK